MPDEQTLREAADEIVAAPSDDADVEVEREQGAPAIEELDAETRARREAALGHVRKFGDPALRASAVPIDRVHAAVERFAGVRVRAQEETGQERQIEAEGLPARIIQHEMDHLDGVLILDRISREARKEAMRAMREAAEGGRRPSGGEPDGGANGAQAEHEAQPAVSSADAGPAGSG